MNEKVNQIYEEEKVISLPNLCFFVLKKWKLMLISAIIFAITAAAVFSYKDYQNYQKNRNMTDEEELAMLGVPEDQKELIHMKLESFKNNLETVQEYEYYYNNSIKVKLDPNNVNQGTATYVVSAEKSGDVLKAISICQDKLFSEEVYEELAQQMSEPVDVSLLKEVIQFKEKYAHTSSNLSEEHEDTVMEYEIVVRHFNEKDCETMLLFMEEKMRELPGILETENMVVKLEMISSKLEQVCDRSLATLSKDVRSGLQSCYEYISITKRDMKDDQLTYYNYLMDKENNPESEEVEKSFVDFLSVKKAVLGAFAGALLVAAIYVLIYLFDNRIHNRDELQSWVGTPVVDLEKGEDSMLTFVSGVVKTNQINRVCLTGTLEQLNEEILQKVKEMLEKQGCEVFVGSGILQNAETLRSATECGNVIFFEKCNSSKEKDLKDALMKASCCGIHILSIVLGK